MASSIDPAVPAEGQATTASVRANFEIARQEINALQDGTAITSLPDTKVTTELDATGAVARTQHDRNEYLPLRSDFTSDADFDTAVAAIASPQLSALQSKFVQSGSTAIASTVQDEVRVLGQRPEQHGATGDGVADDTADIKEAIVEAQAQILSGSSGVYGVGAGVGTGPEVNFGHKVYKVTSALTDDTNQALNYLRIKGDDAILVASAGITVFGGVGYDAKFDGLIFRDGATAINLKTNNVNGTTVSIDKSQFHNQTTACISADATSQSTHLSITRSKFRQAGGGHVLNLSSVDWTNLGDCWIQCSSEVAFKNGTGSHLSIKDCTGVPESSLVAADGRWCDNYYSVEFDNFRFGGEGGGATLVRNYADMDTSAPVNPTRVSVRNCYSYASSGSSEKPVIEFYKLPNIVEFTGDYGFVSSKPFYFDSGLTQSDFANFATHGRVNIHFNYPFDIPDPTSAGTVASLTANHITGYRMMYCKMIQSGNIVLPETKRIKVAEIFGAGDIPASGSGWTQSTAASVSTTTNDYGVSIRRYTATADDQDVTVTHTTYLDPAVLADGEIYTFCIEVNGETVPSPQVIYVSIGAMKYQLTVEPGRKVVSIPFVYLNGTGSPITAQDQLHIEMYHMQNTAVISFGRHWLVKGAHRFESANLCIEGTGVIAAYTDGTGYNTGYEMGDRYYRANAAAGIHSHEVCTVAGTTGTWVGVGNVPSVNVTAVGNVGGGTDNLQSFTLPANTLYAAGKGVRITTWGTAANNSNPKTILLNVGATNLVAQALTVSQVGTWRMEALIFSTGTDTQKYVATLTQAGTTEIHDVNVGTLALDDGATIVMKTQATVTDGGGGINNDDVVSEGFIVEILN